MTLKSTTTLRVYRHPGASRDEEFPVQGDRSRYVRPLELEGSEDDPDVFDIRERLPFEFAGDSPQQAGKRAARMEEDLADAYDGLEVIDNGDEANTNGGDE